MVLHQIGKTKKKEEAGSLFKSETRKLQNLDTKRCDVFGSVGIFKQLAFYQIQRRDSFCTKAILLAKFTVTTRKLKKKRFATFKIGRKIYAVVAKDFKSLAFLPVCQELMKRGVEAARMKTEGFKQAFGAI